ncbi:MAG: vitamin K epoxide reductase family protein, partial [Anaerolineae bacterium]
MMVQAVLFYSPSCPHCHQVIVELLEPMLADYEGQLKIVGIDTSQPGGAELYRAAVERFEIPSERQGVPTMIVGDLVLVGSLEIPEQFPTIVEEGLAAGGIPWPDVPGLAQALAPARPEPSSTVTPETNTLEASAPATAAAATAPPPTRSPDSSLTPTPVLALQEPGEDTGLNIENQGPASDPLGFGLAGVILASMVLSVGFSGWRISRPGIWQRLGQISTLERTPIDRATTAAIPLLAGVGLAVAGYLAYVEITHVAAVCGPVGECNAVQTSAYALFLGIPVAVWGLLYYLAVVALWAGQRVLVGRWANLSRLGLLGLTLFGTLFSIYLTCLELFAIQAICSWCLSSAVISTVLMLLAAR